MKLFLCFFGVLLVELIGIAFEQEILSVVILGIYSIVLYFSPKIKKDIFPFLIVLILATQNFFMGLFAHALGNTNSRLSFITQYGTILTYVVAFFILLKKKLNKIDIIFVFMTILLVFSFLINIKTVSITGAINYFRNYTCFYCFYLIGERAFKGNSFKLKKFVNFIVILGVAMSAIGLVYNFLPYSFFEFMGINEIYIAKGDMLPSASDFTGRFTTTIFQINVQRIGSIIYEPINFGYFLIAPLIIAFYSLSKRVDAKNFIFFIIITLGFLTTFAKGPWLLVGSLGLIYIIYSFLMKIREFKNYDVSSYGFSLAIILLFVTSFSIYYYKNIGNAVNTHFWAIERTFINFLNEPIFGYGLGSGGNSGSQIHGWLESGGESGLMGLLYQVGIVFGFPFIFVFLYLSYDLYKKYRKYIMVTFLPICLLIISIFQENTYSPQCIGVIMLFLGVISNFREESSSTIKNN